MTELLELIQKFSKENQFKTGIEISTDDEGNIEKIEFSYFDPAESPDWRFQKFSSTEKAIEGIKALINLKKATA